MDRNHNPHELKTHQIDWEEGEKLPSGSLDSDRFIKYLNRKGLVIERKDNLPRFANNNDIKMTKVTRVGSAGSTPTVYYPPSDSKMQKIITIHKNNNKTLLGQEIVKKKKKEILKIFDNAKDKSVSKTSIAKEVEKKLGVRCNRKMVRKILNDKRGSQLEKKLSKIG